jgi:hypothetical protein
VGEVGDGEVYAEDEAGEMRCRSRFCSCSVLFFWLGPLYFSFIYITFRLILLSISTCSLFYVVPRLILVYPLSPIPFIINHFIRPYSLYTSHIY